MDEGNKTALRHCRFLNNDYFLRLYDAFIEAFSDYVIPFALTEDQFRNHIALNAVDLERTAGCEENGKLVGFSLNGFGTWDGRQTVYDAGTGVIPSHRRRGVSREMFEMMLPAFAEGGIEQFLLEVITTNEAAIALYEKLGFRRRREVALLQRDERLDVRIGRPDAIDLRIVDEPDWDRMTSFWDGYPSWQNSIAAVERSRVNKRIIAAFAGDKCVGYIVFSSIFGRVAHIAVDKDHRRQGVGTALVLAMQDEMADGFSMQVINLDKSLTSTMAFFHGLGFHDKLCQFEMIRPL